MQDRFNLAKVFVNGAKVKPFTVAVDLVVFEKVMKVGNPSLIDMVNGNVFLSILLQEGFYVFEGFGDMGYSDSLAFSFFTLGDVMVGIIHQIPMGLLFTQEVVL